MDLSYIAQAPIAVIIHLIVALLALVFGLLMWFRPKGTPSHKLIGRGFIGLMIITATTAIFIRQLNGGHFSWIHIFVPITFIGAYQIVSTIRRGEVERHKKHVRNMFFGALLIPGLASFLPGRTLWMTFFA